MAIHTQCQTPGALYETSIDIDGVAIGVVLPFKLELSDEEAALLEANLHNAIELVLVPYFRDK